MPTRYDTSRRRSGPMRKRPSCGAPSVRRNPTSIRYRMDWRDSARQFSTTRCCWSESTAGSGAEFSALSSDISRRSVSSSRIPFGAGIPRRRRGGSSSPSAAIFSSSGSTARSSEVSWVSSFTQLHASGDAPHMKSLACLMLIASPLAAQMRPVSTYSIVARDSATGQIGVAVQSHWFAVGQIVPWAEAGVGAVATQSFVDPSYGKLGLDLLRAGKSAPEALRALLHGDAACAVRQVGMIDAKGNVATFTGSRDIIAAGGIAGAQSAPTRVQCGESGGTLIAGRKFAVQANLMANEKVWPAMAKAFTEGTGDLADRMLAALDAAQAAGGDIRGKQSAALVVVN